MNFQDAVDQNGNKLKLNLQNIAFIEEEDDQLLVHFTGKQSPLRLEKAKNSALFSDQQGSESDNGAREVKPFRRGGHVSHG
jgi:hypothetical protein